jgi:O-methyltransferase
VEAGCWRGGTGAYMAKVSGRKTYLLDSFQGFPDISEKDSKLEATGKLKGYLKVAKQDVVDICNRLGVLNNVEIIEGYFNETIPKTKDKIGNIAVLRLDGDLYSSTKEVLDMLYDSVVPGGYIIIDDYDDFDGCRLAVHEFLGEKHISTEIYNYPSEGKAFFRKTSKN